MNNDPKIDKKLAEKLSSYEVDMPEFSLKRSRWERFINYLASPGQNPFERFSLSTHGLATMNVIPIVGALILSLIQILTLI